jgi:DNA-directed RNA polymerase specialized sigma24 family protein
VHDRPSRDGDRSGQRVAEAFSDLFAAYEQRIFNAVYRLVGDYDDAAD